MQIKDNLNKFWEKGKGTGKRNVFCLGFLWKKRKKKIKEMQLFENKFDYV